MSRSRITCPKCGHVQSYKADCDGCGLIFAKFQERERKAREVKAAEIAKIENLSEVKDSKGSMPLVATIIILLILTSALTYYFTKPNQIANITKAESFQTNDDDQIDEDADLEVIEEISFDTDLGSQDSGQNNFVASSGDAVQHALRATVSIKTPWGTGSGFFITPDKIVTNRHVVEVDRSSYKTENAKLQKVLKLVKLEKQKIRQLRDQYKSLPSGPTKKQLRIIIKDKEESLAKYLPNINKQKSALAKMKRAANSSDVDIKVYLSDGTMLNGYGLNKSNKHDLAIFSVSTNDPTVIRQAGNSRRLREGEKVYTVGSPVGLQNTVTSGIFSGYRKHSADGNIYLQTDAAINPGNSGGPIIDENGYVQGVNTMILLNTEGIGFAIPIKVVYEDFSYVF
ncbi:MAG: trypsin-like peptidase domain-containing protein [Desulfotalea sp.]